MTGDTLISRTSSHTHGNEVDLIVAREFLHPTARVLIIDDFLATGLTITSLIQLVHMAGATPVGIGALIEKDFEGGRARLIRYYLPIYALAHVISMDGDKIQIVEEL